MPVIAHRRREDYLPAMTSALWRLVALIALLAMPAGMTAAPAMAHAEAAGAESHCGDHQQPAESTAAPQLHCTGCTALPAMETPAAIGTALPQTPVLISPTDAVSEIDLEIATPPPKLS